MQQIEISKLKSYIISERNVFYDVVSAFYTIWVSDIVENRVWVWGYYIICTYL